MSKKIRSQVADLIEVIILQCIFLAAFAGKTNDTVWLLVPGLLVITLETALTVYGIRKKQELGFPVLTVGSLLVLGIALQAFYGGAAPVRYTVLLVGGGVTAFFCARFIKEKMLTDGSEGDEKICRIYRRLPDLHVYLCILMFFLSAADLAGVPLFNSAGAIEIGGFLLYPGEILVVLFVLHAACLVRKSDGAEKGRIHGFSRYIAASLVGALALNMAGDIGNSYTVIILLFIFSILVSSSKIGCMDRWTGLLGCVWAAGMFIVILFHGNAGTPENVGTVYAGITDCAGTFIGLCGRAGPYPLMIVAVCLLLCVRRIPNTSRALCVLGIQGAVALYLQSVFHIGGNLGLVPTYGVGMPFVSSDITGMLCSFILFGGVIAAVQSRQENAGLLTENSAAENAEEIPGTDMNKEC